MCNFTQQELLVLSLIAKGMVTKEISEELKFSENRIKEYRKLVYEKLNAKNRVQAVVKAILFELISV